MNKKRKAPVQVAIFHNILWSKYKGGVFSEIHRIAPQYGMKATFYQIAETEGDRIALGGIDMSYHRYPFTLLFKGAYHKTPLPLRVIKLGKIAFKTSADMVILPGYEKVEYWVMLAMLVLRGKPRAVFCDSTAYDRPRTILKGLAKRLFFRLCNGFFGYGTRSKEYLMSFGVPSSKIFFRCQAAALPLDYSEQDALRKRLDLVKCDPSSPQYLYVGRLSEEKGLYTLLDAFRLIRHSHPQAQLLIVGAGPMKRDLDKRITSLGLASSVSLPGSMSLDQLMLAYAEATALILASTSEPWGLVANEALSMGCPVVVSDRCGCVVELVVEGRTGYSFKAGDPEQLADRMMMILSEMGDVKSVAVQCIDHMRKYSPQNAATQILTGSLSIMRTLEVTGK